MKSPKKSENLEVRLSHQDKTALQNKAAQEGRSVSVVIRGLISDYLAQPITRSRPNQLMELFMTLKSKPKSVLAAALACVALPFTFSSFAAAEEVSLRINGEYTQPVTEDGVAGKRVRRFDTDLHINTNDAATIEIDSTNGPLQIRILTEEVENGLSLQFKILNDGKAWDMSPKMGTYESPTLISDFGTPIRVEIGYEGGEIFILDALPTKL